MIGLRDAAQSIGVRLHEVLGQLTALHTRAAEAVTASGEELQTLLRLAIDEHPDVAARTWIRNSLRERVRGEAERALDALLAPRGPDPEVLRFVRDRLLDALNI